jgi:large subunit ribosomal protein L15
MARLGKRNRKFLGSRNHGKGNAKNRRGKGNKGGWGRAGMHKHRFSYITVHERHFMAHGGRYGFHNQNATPQLPVVNLWHIEQLALSGKLEKRDGRDYYEFEGKVLGSGQITRPVTVKAARFSGKAAEKIKAAGGSAEATQAQEKAE